MILEGLTAATVICAPTVAIVGDSITAHDIDTIQPIVDACTTGPVHIDGAGGRQVVQADTPWGWIEPHMAVVERLERDIDPDVWIIEGGTNDELSGSPYSPTEAIAWTVAHVEPTDTVYWVEPSPERTDSEAWLVAAAEQGVETIGWGGIPTTDGIHPDSAGAAQMAENYCETMNGGATR